MTSDSVPMPTAVIVGASRGLGAAIVAELFTRGWRVIGTVRDPDAPTPLRELADGSDGRVTVERLDVTDVVQIAELRERLAGRDLDVLFVNAGTATNDATPIGEVSTEEFVEVMVTNALSPLRVIEGLDDLVTPNGLIGVMSSGQGSITNISDGGRDLYRGSKAALNMLMRTYAAREPDSARAFLVMAPGWIQTALGGSGAPFTIEEAIPLVVDVLLEKRGRPGIEYLDRFGRTVPW